VWWSCGREDIGAELRLINERLDRQDRTLSRIERKQDITMALVAIEQGDLDSIAVTISQVAETLQAVLDSDTPLSPADESGVQEALTKLKAVGPRVPENAPPVNPPAEPETPETPVDETPAPGEDPVSTPVEETPVEESPTSRFGR
jgi:hypothetical protein